MNDTPKRLPAMEGVFEDYATVPVPESHRISWAAQGSVWAGATFCVTLFSLSGTMASSMTFSAFAASVLLGAALVTAVAVLMGSIGARTHLPSAFNARFALGAEGGKLFGLVLAVSLSGWFGWQCAYFAESTVSVLGMFGISGSSPALWAVVGGMLMIVTVVSGFRGITLLSVLSAPLLFALALAAAGAALGRTDLASLAAGWTAPENGMSLGGGIALVAGSFITGSCIVPDMSRFSRRPRDSDLACLLGFAAAFPALWLLGGLLCRACGTADLCEVMISHCGMGVFVPFVLVVSIWTTNDYNLYCAVLGISNAFDDHVRLPHWLITLVVGAVSTLLGALGLMEVFSFFLNLLSALIPPTAAVIIADYYLYNRDSGLYDYENRDKLRNFRADTCTAALAGIVVGLLCNYTSIRFLQALCSVLPACIVAMLAGVAALVIFNTAARSRASAKN